MTAPAGPLVLVEEVTKIYNRGEPDEVQAVRGISMTISGTAWPMPPCESAL